MKNLFRNMLAAVAVFVAQFNSNAQPAVGYEAPFFQPFKTNITAAGMRTYMGLDGSYTNNFLLKTNGVFAGTLTGSNLALNGTVDIGAGPTIRFLSSGAGWLSSDLIDWDTAGNITATSFGGDLVSGRVTTNVTFSEPVKTNNAITLNYLNAHPPTASTNFSGIQFTNSTTRWKIGTDGSDGLQIYNTNGFGILINSNGMVTLNTLTVTNSAAFGSITDLGDNALNIHGESGVSVTASTANAFTVGLGSGSTVFQVQDMSYLSGDNGFNLLVTDGGDPWMQVDSDTTTETHYLPVFAPSFHGILTDTNQIQGIAYWDGAGNAQSTGSSVSRFETVFNGGNVPDGLTITNLQSSNIVHTLTQTNIVIGQLYTNTATVPVQICGLAAALVEAAIAGRASVSVGISGQFTNTPLASITSAVGTIVGSDTNALPTYIVPAGSTYKFTDTSTGAGNSVTLVGGQIFK